MEVDPERPAGIDGVPQLPRAVDEPAEVAARRTVAERKLHLADTQPRPRRVDRHPHLAAEPGRNGKHAARAAGESAR